MNPMRVLKDSIPALQQVFERILEELEEINDTNKKILIELEKLNSKGD